MPQNGEKNTRFGVYKSACCGAEIVISEGSIFPDCPNHPHFTVHWTCEETLQVMDPVNAKKKTNDSAA